jgi:hypothetical protein
MSDIAMGKTGEKEKRPYIAKEATEKVLSWIENGTAPFLPNADGVVDTHGIRSGHTGHLFKGMNQILAKGYLTEMGKTDDKIITFKQAMDAQTFIKKGEKNFSLSVYDAEKNQLNVYTYFPVSATTDPEKIKPQRQHQESQNNVKVIECNESNPEKYLAKYLAAVSIGAKFEPAPGVVENFKKEFSQALQQGIDDKKYTRIFEIGNKASASVRDELKQMFAATKEVKDQEQTQEKEKKVQQRDSQQFAIER